MVPILVNLPSAVLKGMSLSALVGGLVLAVAVYRKGGITRDRWLGVGLTLMAGGVVLFRFMSGSWTFLSPGSWKTVWPALPIYSYGVMLGLSLFVGWYVAIWLARGDGLPPGGIGYCYVVTALAALVCARLLYIVTTPEMLRGSLTDLFNVRRGGLVAYGGFLGGLLGSTLYCRLRKLPLLLWADCAVPAIALGTSVTRIGCLLYGCDYGKLAPTLPWGIRFPQGSPAYNDHLRQHLIESTASLSEKVHPTQIYESAVGLSAFFFLLWLRRRRQFAGQVFLAFALYYGVLRYAIELFRGDEDRGRAGIFSTSQLIAVVTVAAALAAYALLYRRYRHDPEGSRPWETLLEARRLAAEGQRARPSPAARSGRPARATRRGRQRRRSGS